MRQRGIAMSARELGNYGPDSFRSSLYTTRKPMSWSYGIHEDITTRPEYVQHSSVEKGAQETTLNILGDGGNI